MVHRFSGVRADADDPDGGQGMVIAVGLDMGDPVDDVEAADGFAEDGVFPVQVPAADGILDQIELGAGRFPHRVRQVAAAGGGQGPFLVPVLRQDFRVDGVARTALAPFLDPRGVAGVRVAALDHESGDDPVEKDVVIQAREGQPGEILPVLGRVLVQFDADGTHGRDDVENRLLRQPAPGIGQGKINVVIMFFQRFSENRGFFLAVAVADGEISRAGDGDQGDTVAVENAGGCFIRNCFDGFLDQQVVIVLRESGKRTQQAEDQDQSGPFFHGSMVLLS